MLFIPLRVPPRRIDAAHGIRLQVVKLPQAKRGFILLPKRWVVEMTLPHCSRTAVPVRMVIRLA